MKHTDRTVVGAIAGIAGGAALVIYLHLLGLFVPPAPKIILSVGTLFYPANQIDSIEGQIIAHVAHLVVSALLGIVFINVFRLTGKDWVITKGLIFGLAVWIILSGAVTHLLGLSAKKPNFSVAMAVFTSHVVFGVVTSLSALFLSNKVEL